jgi:prevent-host-death family protein
MVIPTPSLGTRFSVQINLAGETRGGTWHQANRFVELTPYGALIMPVIPTTGYAIPRTSPAALSRRACLAHVSYSQRRKNLASHMDAVCDARAPRLVTRRNARSAVLMSADDYEGLMPTLFACYVPSMMRGPGQADGD